MITASPELERMIAKPVRQRAEPTGHMRERIAVALRVSRPSFVQWLPSDGVAYNLYLMESEKMRAMYDEWADRLLIHLDALDLELIDKRAE